MSTGGIKKKIPNILTLSRFVFTAGLIILFFLDNYVWAFIFFLLGACTDPFDGYFARKWKVVSDWGKKWDPLADKALTWTSYLLLIIAGVHYIFVVFFVMFFLREVITNRMKNKLEKKEIFVAATKAAKRKTINQVIMLGWLWLAIMTRGMIAFTDYLFAAAFIFGLIAFGLAYYSGYDYAMLYKKHYSYTELFKKTKGGLNVRL